MKTAIKFFLTLLFLSYLVDIAFGFYNDYRYKKQLKSDIKTVVLEISNSLPIETSDGILENVEFNQNTIFYDIKFTSDMPAENEATVFENYISFEKTFFQCTDDNSFVRDVIEGGYNFKLNFFNENADLITKVVVNSEACKNITNKKIDELTQIYIENFKEFLPLNYDSAIKMTDLKSSKRSLFLFYEISEFDFGLLTAEQLKALKNEILDLAPSYSEKYCATSAKIFLLNNYTIVNTFLDKNGAEILSFNINNQC